MQCLSMCVCVPPPYGEVETHIAEGWGSRDVSSGVPRRNECSSRQSNCRERQICAIQSWTDCPKPFTDFKVQLYKKLEKGLHKKYDPKTQAFGNSDPCIQMQVWGAQSTQRDTDRYTSPFLDPDILERSKLSFFMSENKPTFTSSCLKLLLNICNTVSKETVRGSMKFSNSSSSSPIRETKGSPWFKMQAIVH